MYIKPPRGNIQLEDLTECVVTRFQYFLYKYRSQVIEQNSLKFEYLSLGTALDRVGHFTLRLLAAHCNDLSQFIALSEANFFVERLNFSSPRQIIQILNTVLRHLEEAGSPEFDNTIWRKDILEVLTLMKHAFKTSHMNGFNHDEGCCQYVCKVPFQMCLKMIAKRELQLQKGIALVPCGKWRAFLICFMETFFINETFNVKSSPVFKQSMSDERLKELKQIITRLFYSNSHCSSSQEIVKSSDVRVLHKMFPPCMANLYDNLKKNHRLSHYARFNFSIFLKDIGMSLDESINFWRNEYSQPNKCGNKCSHSWQQDSAKYMYSIRHLYGLEGKRANYCAPSCYKIQNNNLGPVEEGGCPFLTYDEDQLRNCLNPKEETEMIMQLRKNDCTKACNFYRKTILKVEKLDVSTAETHRSPVEYFYLLRKDLQENSIKF